MAQETTEVPITDSPVSSSVMSLDYFAPRYQNVKWDTHRIRDNKCRDHSKPHLWPWARQVAAHYRDERLAIVRTWKARAQDRSSRCFTSWPAVGQRLAAGLYGWTGWNWTALFTLWNHESGWNPCRHYPSTTNCFYTGDNACGIPQRVPCDGLILWPGEAQIRWGLRYIRDRYGSPANAYAFSLANGWY